MSVVVCQSKFDFCVSTKTRKKKSTRPLTVNLRPRPRPRPRPVIFLLRLQRLKCVRIIQPRHGHSVRIHSLRIEFQKNLKLDTKIQHRYSSCY